MTLAVARPRRAAPTLVVALALAVQTAAPAMAVAAPARVEIKAGRADAFSRVELQGARPSSVRREDRDLILRFARAGAPDMALLHSTPPPHVEKAEVRTSGGEVELRLTAAPDAEIRTGWADGATWVNFVPRAPDAAAPARASRPDPRPVGGVVPVRSELAGATLKLRFAWRAPLGAAVFRRANAVWVVFDTPARLNLAAAPHGLAQARKVEAVEGPGWTGVRIAARADLPVSAAAEGGTWTVAIGPEAAGPTDAVRLDQDVSGPAALAAHVAGATGVFWITDPAVGDRMAAVTALAPAKGLAQGRTVVGAELLPAAQGLAVRAAADDLQVAVEGDLVRVGRPRGLALSPPGALKRAEARAPEGLPAAAASPGFVDFAAWSRTGEGGFTARYDALLARAAEEGGAGRGAPTAARMGLARFLVGSELAFEAVGLLNTLIRQDPTLSVDSEFRGLRGAARAMAGRWRDAEADFSTPVTGGDPASALWRGYVAWRLGDAAAARAQFAHGRTAAAAFAPKWRARFARADAEAATAGGDFGLARQVLAGAGDGPGLAPEEADGLRLAAARLADASGDGARALALYKALTTSPMGGISAPATLRATQLELARGGIAAPEAMATLDSLRFRWRGDAVELETIRALGQAYLEQGRFREALSVLRSAGGRLPDLPAAAQLQADLGSAFKSLFLDGQADGLQPIQALALFYDFKELTPIGADGDLMVRRLVRRLVDVDLLDQAADLLRYQVDNRLEGVGRAQVATDLALIELMARRPEQALGAIANSRNTLLPAVMNGQRRLIEARALLDLGRTDHALEVLGADKGPEATELRALAAWRGKDWPTAGRMAEARLGDRWRDPRPLDGTEAALLLRAGVAFSLAQDDGALTRLRTRYAALADRSAQPEALRVALAGLAETPAAGAGAAVAQASGDAQAFAGWVSRMKARFRQPATAAPPAPPPRRA